MRKTRKKRKQQWRKDREIKMSKIQERNREGKKTQKGKCQETARIKNNEGNIIRNQQVK